MQGPTLEQKVATLRAQLSLGAGPIAEVAARAVSTLGIESQVKGLNLVEKVDKCLEQVLPRAEASMAAGPGFPTTAPVASAVAVAAPVPWQTQGATTQPYAQPVAQQTMQRETVMRP